MIVEFIHDFNTNEKIGCLVAYTKKHEDGKEYVIIGLSRLHPNDTFKKKVAVETAIKNSCEFQPIYIKRDYLVRGYKNKYNNTVSFFSDVLTVKINAFIYRIKKYYKNTPVFCGISVERIYEDRTN